MKGKYIIFERDGLEFPVLFPEHFVAHNEIKGAFTDKPVSAGFFSFRDGKTNCYGKSVSLDLQVRKEDCDLIARQFNSE